MTCTRWLSSSWSAYLLGQPGLCHVEGGVSEACLGGRGSADHPGACLLRGSVLIGLSWGLLDHGAHTTPHCLLCPPEIIGPTPTVGPELYCSSPILDRRLGSAWAEPGAFFDSMSFSCLGVFQMTFRPQVARRVPMGHWFSSVQLLSHVRLLATPWTAARQASLSITNSRSLLKLKSIESVMPSNHLILCCPLLLLPSIFPSIGVFSNESVLCIRWPKYWSFSFCISPSSEYSGLIFFRMDWLHLLAVQGTLKSLLQHHSSEASVLWPSAFFIVQLSHPSFGDKLVQAGTSAEEIRLEGEGL